MDLKEKVSTFLKDYVPISKKKIYESLEIPPDDKFGDVSFPCFELAKKEKISPGHYSKQLREKLVLPDNSIFGRIEVAGPYLNFFVNYTKFIPKILKEVNKNKAYGRASSKKEKIMLEYISPNPLKDLHAGHLRQAAVGGTLSRTMDFAGYSVIPVLYYNDSGTHIAKTIWAYEKFSKDINNVESKGAYLGKLYSLAHQKSKNSKKAQEEIRKIHKALENNEKKYASIKKKLYPWSIKYFEKFYKDVNAKFDKIYFDSDFVNSGKKIVKKLEKTKYLYYEDNTPVLDLTEFNLPKTLLLKSDRTALYLTKDLAMAFQRIKDFKIDKIIYITGSEQKLNFQQLFKALEILKLKNSDKLFHIPIELVYDKEGKRFSSRQGNAASYFEILKKAEDSALKKINSSEREISEKQKQEIAHKTAIGALLYFINKISYKKSINLDIEKALSFEGQTGPYLQYSYVRALRITQKAKAKPLLKHLTSLNTQEEIRLTKKIYKFPLVVEQVAKSYQPHVLAEYAFELSSDFSRFYENCSISKVADSLASARLYLVYAYIRVIKQCLRLLGIPVLEKM